MTFRAVFLVGASAISLAACARNTPTLGVSGKDWEWASHFVVDSDYAVVLGIVTDSATGRPPDGRTEARITPADEPLHATTNVTRQGRFALRSLPGENALGINSGVYLPKAFKLNLKRGSFDTLRIVLVPDTVDHSKEPPPAYEFDQGAGNITGIIIDSTTGKPIEHGASAALVPLGSGEPVSSKVDSAGVFSLYAMPGSYRLLIRSQGYNGISKDVTIGAERTDMLRLVMTRDLNRILDVVPKPSGKSKLETR